jgi:hypothetical protein
MIESCGDALDCMPEQIVCSICNTDPKIATCAPPASHLPLFLLYDLLVPGKEDAQYIYFLCACS